MYRFIIRPLLRILLFLVALAVGCVVFYAGPKHVETLAKGVVSGKIDVQEIVSPPKAIGNIQVKDKWGTTQSENVLPLEGTPLQKAYQSIMQSKQVLLSMSNYSKTHTPRVDANFHSRKPVDGKWSGVLLFNQKPVARFTEDGKTYKVLSFTPLKKE